jgi:hypothetical protein
MFGAAFLGKSVKVFLRDGGAFWLKVTAAGPGYISGYDDEGLDLYIKVDDIDFVEGAK